MHKFCFIDIIYKYSQQHTRGGAEKPRGKAARITTNKKNGIGTWNVRTLYQTGKLEILINQMETLKWDTLGVSETHWIDSGKFRFEGHKILCSGNKTNNGSCRSCSDPEERCSKCPSRIQSYIPAWLLLDSRQKQELQLLSRCMLQTLQTRKQK